MNKTNILVVIWSLKHWWGAEKIASMIWNNLYDEWYNIKYLTFYNACEKYEFKWEELCLNETLSENIFVKILKLFIRAHKIKKICKNEKIAISLSHMEEANFSNIISKILFWNKSKIIIQIHQPIEVWWKLYKIMIKFLYNYADKIITLGNQEKFNLVHIYNINKEKIEIIHNPIDINKINILTDEDLADYKYIFESWKINFINIWRLTFPKNQALLINVFKKFNKKYNNTQLVILWEWNLRYELESLIWSNKNIYLLWNQINPYKFLKKSHLFVFTSIYEWFWIAIIEAMSCWLPIISTDCPTWPKEILKKEINNFSEVKEISLDDYGILTPVFDENIIFQAMEKIYLDENIRNYYKEKSLERSKDFDINMIMEKWKLVLTKAIK